jgi:ubiquinone biosynthesis protein UbiJ
MATPSSPFAFLEGIAQGAANLLQPPPWLVTETQRRGVLFLNHVLQQEPEAMARLARQKGRVVLVQWRTLALRLAATPAGLFELAAEVAVPDLTLTVTDESPFALAQAVLRGDKPGVRIEGDVLFAAEINWLVDNLRWDVEDDLARVIGDVPAHTLGDMGRRVAEALRSFVAARKPGAGTEPPKAPE